ncbi:MAG: GlsB/YeaQ/YmgE family stress response membrane protein [Erysipelotrichaceae bacterium]|nr:GlsB/YeaQ/YmgE family stress response membrane protein [Erysipelotrichaceae bacterium]
MCRLSGIHVIRHQLDIVKSVVLGVVGGLVAKILFGIIGISFNGIIADFIAGVLGAIIVVYIMKAIKL